MSVNQWIVYLQPKSSERTRGLTTTHDEALATRGFLLESEGVRFSEVTYVDPASSRVGKELVACRVSLDTIDDIVVECCCRGVERSRRGDFLDGWLSVHKSG